MNIDVSVGMQVAFAGLILAGIMGLFKIGSSLTKLIEHVSHWTEIVKSLGIKMQDHDHRIGAAEVKIAVLERKDR